MKRKKAIIFDVETTGIDKSKDRVIQFSALVVDWDTLLNAEYNGWKELVNQADYVVERRFLPDDGTEVSLGARAINGQSRETLKDCPGFGNFAMHCRDIFNSVDVVITYNGMVFDIPFISMEMKRYGFMVDWKSKTFYDCFITEKERNPLTLDGTFSRYYGESMEDAGMTAHNALDDVAATMLIFCEQNKEELQKTRRFLTDDGFLVVDNWDGRDCICINKGKYHGIALIEVAKYDPSYLDWVLKSDFSPNTKAIVELAKSKATA